MSNWKEEHQGRRPEEYETDYEYRRYHLWKAYPKDECDFGMKTICYLKPPSFYKKLCKGVKNKVYSSPELRFTIELELSKVVEMVVDRMFTEKLTKGRRITERKSFLNMEEYDKVHWAGLLEYLRSESRSGSSKVLLNNKEYSLIAKPVTKKEAVKRRMAKNVIGY